MDGSKEIYFLGTNHEDEGCHLLSFGVDENM